MTDFKKIFEDVEDSKDHIDLEIDNEKIIDDYLEQIDKLEKGIKVPQVIAITSFAIYLIFLTVFLSINDTHIKVNYLYTLIPSLIGMVSLTIVMNLYIRLIDVYAQAKSFIETKKSDGVNIASLISYFTINITALGIICYLVTLTMKVQQFIIVPMNIINIPVYLIFGVILFYFLFFLPAMIKDNATWSIIFFFSFTFCGFGFILAVSMLIDHTLYFSYLVAFAILWIPLFILQAWTIEQIFSKDEPESVRQSSLYGKVMRLFMVFLIVLFAVLLPLKLEGNIVFQNWALMLLPLLAYLMLFSERIKTWFYTEDKNDFINFEKNI